MLVVILIHFYVRIFLFTFVQYTILFSTWCSEAQPVEKHQFKVCIVCSVYMPLWDRISVIYLWFVFVCSWDVWSGCGGRVCILHQRRAGALQSAMSVRGLFSEWAQSPPPPLPGRMRSRASSVLLHPGRTARLPAESTQDCHTVRIKHSQLLHSVIFFLFQGEEMWSFFLYYKFNRKMYFLYGISNLFSFKLTLFSI